MTPSASAMIDPFGRRVSYLRISVTDRCDFRCVYCMSETTSFLPRKDLLSLEEIDRLASAFIAKGVRKVRLTGGEPLVRKNLVWLIRSLSRHLGDGLDELTLTTNGSQLARYAAELADCGVARVNVSLDTLDPAKFRTITRWGDFHQVMAGIDAADRAGLKIKINTVALRGVNEDEIEALIEFCHGRGFGLTLIETMPMGETGTDRTEQYLPLSWCGRGSLSASRSRIVPIARVDPPATSRCARPAASSALSRRMTHNFCKSCNRVRSACTGTLYMCLGQEDAADLRAPLRASEADHLSCVEAIRRGHRRASPRGMTSSLSRGARAIGLAALCQPLAAEPRRSRELNEIVDLNGLRAKAAVPLKLPVSG